VDLKVNPTNNNMFYSKARRSGGGVIEPWGPTIQRGNSYTWGFKPFSLNLSEGLFRFNRSIC